MDLSVLCLADSVIIEIIDNGPSIPLNERERVFDPFYQILGSKQIGSGLELSIVAVIAKRISADIALKYANTEDETRIIVSLTLPIQE
ncbi:ATP-binding protein [Leeia speluncae]|uniref:ATP-binding protein n=1 Tax=Leeia speluncae TaxID=2884804 RepID=UPI0035716CAC